MSCIRAVMYINIAGHIARPLDRKKPHSVGSVEAEVIFILFSAYFSCVHLYISDCQSPLRRSANWCSVLWLSKLWKSKSHVINLKHWSLHHLQYSCYYD